MMLTKRAILQSSLALAGLAGAGAASLGRGAMAQGIDQLQLFVPAAPGGGWDQTARTIEAVLRANNQIKTAQVTNVPGAGGVVGLPQFLNQWRGRQNALMVGGMVMVGAIIANKAPVKLTSTMPVARLTGEFLAVVVPANSPFKTMGELVAALKADPAKVPVAGGSAGGSDHILLGMIGKAAGVPASRLSYVAFAGGGPAQAAILGGHVAAGISGFGEFGEQIKAGKMRALAISADARQPGIDVPTLKEQGVDVELFNWRGVFAPPGVTPAQRDAMVGMMETMAKSAAWQEECRRRDWTSIPLFGGAYGTFIEGETARIEAILKDLGLAT